MASNTSATVQQNNQQNIRTSQINYSVRDNDILLMKKLNKILNMNLHKFDPAFIPDNSNDFYLEIEAVEVLQCYYETIFSLIVSYGSKAHHEPAEFNNLLNHNWSPFDFERVEALLFKPIYDKAYSSILGMLSSYLDEHSDAQRLFDVIENDDNTQYDNQIDTYEMGLIHEQIRNLYKLMNKTRNKQFDKNYDRVINSAVMMCDVVISIKNALFKINEILIHRNEEAILPNDFMILKQAYKLIKKFTFSSDSERLIRQEMGKKLDKIKIFYHSSYYDDLIYGATLEKAFELIELDEAQTDYNKIVYNLNYLNDNYGTASKILNKSYDEILNTTTINDDLIIKKYIAHSKILFKNYQYYLFLFFPILEQYFLLSIKLNPKNQKR